MDRRLGRYQVTYNNGLTQELDLISHNDFIGIIKTNKDEIYDLINHPDNKNPKTKEYHLKIAAIMKRQLSEMFGDNYFTTESPIYKAIETGILSLPLLQGGDSFCTVIKIK